MLRNTLLIVTCLQQNDLSSITTSCALYHQCYSGGGVVLQGEENVVLFLSVTLCKYVNRKIYVKLHSKNPSHHRVTV